MSSCQLVIVKPEGCTCPEFVVEGCPAPEHEGLVGRGAVSLSDYRQVSGRVMLTMSNYQWVTLRIAVGGGLTAGDVPALEADKVTHICDVTQHDDHTFDPQALPGQFRSAAQSPLAFDVLWLDTADDGASKVEVYKQIPPWFLTAWADPLNRFVFHCDGGCNRGPSACYLALRLLEWHPVDAVAAIRAARPQVGPDCLRYVDDADAAIAALGYA